MPIGLKNSDGIKSVSEFVEKMGGNFGVELAPLCIQDTGELVNQNYIRRADNGKLLALVGGHKRTGYTLLQNSRAFAPFQAWVDSGSIEIESGGSVLGGKANWISGRVIGNDGDVAAGDSIHSHFTLYNPFDGKTAVYAMFSNKRMVCNNQLLGMAKDTANSKLRIRHTGMLETNFDKIMEIVDIAKADFRANLEQYQFLASRKVNPDDVKKYVKKLWEVPQDENELSTRMANIVESVIETIETGIGQNVASTRGSYFWLWQGVNNFLNYKDGRNEENRFTNLMFGENAAFDQKAYNLAVSMANAA
jgi:phage/plasmid-like protein (TIGR03299 family)